MTYSATTTVPAIALQCLTRLQNRTARIGVIGLGYVGLPLCLLLSDAGFQVTGFDIDQKKVEDLESGRSYIFRIAGTEIEAARTQGFQATTDFSRLSTQDAVLVCVPTPLSSHHEPDLSFIQNTVHGGFDDFADCKSS